MPRSSNPLSLHLTSFQALSHPTIRCSKEDYSLTQTLTDIDSERTTSKSQLTAHTELEFILTSEMDPPPSTETKVEVQTMSQTLWEDQSRTPVMPGPRRTPPDRLEDTNILIQILTTSNQEPYGKKCSPRPTESTLSRTWPDLSVPLEEISKKVC